MIVYRKTHIAKYTYKYTNVYILVYTVSSLEQVFISPKMNFANRIFRQKNTILVIFFVYQDIKAFAKKL